MKETLMILGRGIGQVMFQNNALSGLLMLAGIFLCSWQLGALAIVGNMVSTLAAYLSGYNRDDIRNGLYGFNGTLVGIAFGVFMQVTSVSFLMMAVAACVSTWIARLFSLQRVLPGFTAPFIMAVWVLLGFCNIFMPEMLASVVLEDSLPENLDWLQAVGTGIGQVMFQGSILSGLLFLSGILVNSRIAAAYTVLGTVIPIPVALMLGVDADALNMGLMGYNGVLCAIALGEYNLKSCAWALLSVVLSVVLQVVGMYVGLVTLTAPFVVAVWMVKGLSRFQLWRKQMG